MILLLYIFLAALLLFGVRYNRDGWYDPFERKTTNAIKGFFIAVVFVRHIFGYVQAGGWSCGGLPDRLFILLNRCIGQLLVVMFLFYSGYGVMTALRKKGSEYLRTMPKRRILTTLLNFDVAVMVFVIVDLCLGVKLEIGKVGLALICWESVGNSNWYIFDILLCYSLFWLVFLCCRRRNGFALEHGASFLTIIMACAVVVLSFVRPEWWSNTIMAFPIGCLWAAHREKIEGILKHHYKMFLYALLFLTLSLVGISIRWSFGIFYNLFAVVFAATVVVTSMKICVGNAVLVWAGMNLFPLYIYQRVPMMVFGRQFNGNMGGILMWVYIVLCLSVTCAIAYIYRWFEIKLKR